MQASEKIQSISDERSIMRQELIEIEKALFGFVFAGLTALGVFIGIYFNADFANIPENKVLLFVIISQLEFIIMVFVMGLTAAIYGMGEYIAALEQKINHLAEDCITVWETKVSNSIWRPKSPVFCAFAIFYLSLLTLFIGLGFITAYKIHNWIFTVVITIEIVVCFFLYIWAVIDRKRIRRISITALNLPKIKEST